MKKVFDIKVEINNVYHLKFIHRFTHKEEYKYFTYRVDTRNDPDCSTYKSGCIVSVENNKLCAELFDKNLWLLYPTYVLYINDEKVLVGKTKKLYEGN